MANYNSEFTGEQIDQGVRESIYNPFRLLQLDFSTDFDNEGLPTQETKETLATGNYTSIRIFNIPISENTYVEAWYSLLLKADSSSTHIRKYGFFDPEDDTYGPSIKIVTASKEGENDATYDEEAYPLDATSPANDNQE